MIVFVDRFTGDELFSDACKPKLTEDGLCFVFDAKLKTEKSDNIDESVFGGNASAEDQQQEQLEGSEKSGFDFVLNHRLVEHSFDKARFKLWMKGYFKKVQDVVKQDKDEDGVKLFQKNASKNVEEWRKELDQFSFFAGEHDELAESTLCMAKWAEDGTSAKVYVVADGVKQVKY